MVLKSLSQEQKDTLKHICTEFAEQLAVEPDPLEKVMTCEER